MMSGQSFMGNGTMAVSTLSSSTFQLSLYTEHVVGLLAVEHQGVGIRQPVLDLRGEMT